MPFPVSIQALVLILLEIRWLLEESFKSLHTLINQPDLLDGCDVDLGFQSHVFFHYRNGLCPLLSLLDERRSELRSLGAGQDALLFSIHVQVQIVLNLQMVRLHDVLEINAHHRQLKQFICHQKRKQLMLKHGLLQDEQPVEGNSVLLLFDWL